MTVQELFQSLEFADIWAALNKKPYKNSLLTEERYKDYYRTLCTLESSKRVGSITFNADGHSDVYMIEGSSFNNIVGMEVFLSDDEESTKISAAADIIWSSGPFGDWTDNDWDALWDYILSLDDSDEENY